VEDGIGEPLFDETRNPLVPRVEESKQPAEIFGWMVAVDSDFPAPWGSFETVGKFTVRISCEETVFYYLRRTRVDLPQDLYGTVKSFIVLYLMIDESSPPDDLHAIQSLHGVL
jgi:hypothetical protein